MVLEYWSAEAGRSESGTFKGRAIYSTRVAVRSGTTSQRGGQVDVLGRLESGGRWRKQCEAEE